MFVCSFLLICSFVCLLIKSVRMFVGLSVCLSARLFGCDCFVSVCLFVSKSLYLYVCLHKNVSISKIFACYVCLLSICRFYR